jgi:hypothetical protein
MNEYWIITDNRTGRVLAHCGDINDAIMMVDFDPCKRTYRKQKFIMDQVIDVTSTTDKQLPGQVGLPAGKVNQLNLHKIKLPEGQQEPLRIL